MWLPRLAFWALWWSIAVPLTVLFRRLKHGPARPTWGFIYETFALWMQKGEWVTRWLPLPVARAILDTAGTTSPFGWWYCRGWADSPVPATWHGREDGPVLLYLHGGAYILGSPTAYRDSLAHISRAAQMRVLAPDYRLAPEHAPPAQLEDALAIYRWLLEQVPADQIFVAGDSAGGNLTTCLLVALREAGDPLPAGAALISPWADLRPLMIEAPHDYVPADLDAVYSRLYAGDRNLDDATLSPVIADLAGLPPMLVMVGEVERLRDVGRALAERVRDSGGTVTFEVAPDQVHAWPLFAAFFKESRRSLHHLGAFARECVRHP